MCVCGTKQDMRENFDRANGGEIWLHRLVCCSEANPIYVLNDLKHREDPGRVEMPTDLDILR